MNWIWITGFISFLVILFIIWKKQNRYEYLVIRRKWYGRIHSIWITRGIKSNNYHRPTDIKRWEYFKQLYCK